MVSEGQKEAKYVNFTKPRIQKPCHKTVQLRSNSPLEISENDQLDNEVSLGCLDQTPPFFSTAAKKKTDFEKRFPIFCGGGKAACCNFSNITR